MVSIEDIPPEQRWEIAVKSLIALPFAYDMVFRQALGEKYDEIELPIWTEAGKETKDLAEALKLPSGNAKEIGETRRIITSILFGPEFKWETGEESENRAVWRLMVCPLMNRAVEMGLEPRISNLSVCQAYVKSSIENLNPEYTLRYNKNMCSGDPYCEFVIERRK